MNKLVVKRKIGVDSVDSAEILPYKKRKGIRTIVATIYSIPKYIMATILALAGFGSMYHIRQVCKWFNTLSKMELYHQTLLKNMCQDRHDKYASEIFVYHLVPPFLKEAQVGDWRQIYQSKIEPKIESKIESRPESKILSNNDICYGTKFISDDTLYEGQLKFETISGNWVRHGLGMLYRRGRCQYIGQFANDNIHGQGIYICSSSKYEGNFENNYKCGYGKMIYASGMQYEGPFVNDMPNGYGKISDDRSVHEGLFKNGIRSGIGILKNDGNIYIGIWDNNVLNGRAFIYYKDGSSYVGTISEGKYHGAGKYSWPNGIRFEGTYANGLREGWGQLISPTEIMRAKYKNDKKDGYVIIKFTNGCMHAYNVVNDVKHGPISFFDANNRLYFSGLCRDGKLDGNAIWSPNPGTTFKIVFSNGQIIDKYDISNEQPMPLSIK